MADIVRILGLDDDIHAPKFVFETGERYDGLRELVAFLSHAHDVEYDVRMFSIVGEYTERLQEFEEHEVDQMFCFLEGLGGVTEKEPGFVFELFWEAADKGWW